MATITSENRAAWQALADAAKAQFPSVGKRVRVETHRNHAGKEGTVRIHTRDKFYSTRYKSDAMLHLMDINGREGFCVQIEQDNGERFWIAANRVTVI